MCCLGVANVPNKNYLTKFETSWKDIILSPSCVFYSLKHQDQIIFFTFTEINSMEIEYFSYYEMWRKGSRKLMELWRWILVFKENVWVEIEGLEGKEVKKDLRDFFVLVSCGTLKRKPIGNGLWTNTIFGFSCRESTVVANLKQSNRAY